MILLKRMTTAEWKPTSPTTSSAMVRQPAPLENTNLPAFPHYALCKLVPTRCGNGPRFAVGRERLPSHARLFRLEV
jgi:hypothetical protein